MPLFSFKHSDHTGVQAGKVIVFTLLPTVVPAVNLKSIVARPLTSASCNWNCNVTGVLVKLRESSVGLPEVTEDTTISLEDFNSTLVPTGADMPAGVPI